MVYCNNVFAVVNELAAVYRLLLCGVILALPRRWCGRDLKVSSDDDSP